MSADCQITAKFEQTEALSAQPGDFFKGVILLQSKTKVTDRTSFAIRSSKLSKNTQLYLMNVQLKHCGLDGGTKI